VTAILKMGEWRGEIYFGGRIHFGANENQIAHFRPAVVIDGRKNGTEFGQNFFQIELKKGKGGSS